jgi:hypothetical protein
MLQDFLSVAQCLALLCILSYVSLTLKNRDKLGKKRQMKVDF